MSYTISIKLRTRSSSTRPLNTPSFLNAVPHADGIAVFQLLSHILVAAAGIAEHRHIAGLCHLVDLVQDGIIRLAAGRSAGHAQAVCKATEHDRLCHHLNIPLHQIAVCLGVHLEQQLHIRDLQRLAVADCLTAVGGIKAIFSHVCT